MSADSFPDFELLPASAETLTPDEELAELVSPDDAEPNDTTTTALPIGRSRFFDFETGQSGALPGWITGKEAVVLVAQAALRTKRGEYSTLPDDFGMDEPEALVGEVYDAERVAAYEDDVTEALLACHERITGVGNFFFLQDLDGEIAYADFDITIDGSTTVRLESIPLA